MAQARNTTAPDLRHDLDTLKDDVGVLKSDVADTVQNVVAAGKAEVGRAVQGAAARGRQAAEATAGYIEERPIQSLAMAFVLGLLIGAILRK